MQNSEVKDGVAKYAIFFILEKKQQDEREAGIKFEKNEIKGKVTT